MNSPTEPQATRSAFTLVELLVVIGIIALLISILLPSLTQVREQANLVKCASNLRQMYAALVMYANEHRDHFPDSNALGVNSMRRLVGTIDPANPAAGPEKWGISAMFKANRYAPGDAAFWTCPGAPDFMKDWGNTYAISPANFDSISKLTSLGRAKGKNASALLNTGEKLSPYASPLIMDNASLLPAKVGDNAAGTGPVFSMNVFINKPGKQFYLYFSHKIRKSLSVAVEPAGAASTAFLIAPGIKRNANNALFPDGVVLALTVENYMDSTKLRPD